MKFKIVGLLLILGATSAIALNFSTISTQDATTGLKEALSKGSIAAVAKLGVKDGFLNNIKVKIPLPDGLKKARKAMKFLGRDKSFEELEISINRAAEAAVPEAKSLLTDAIKQISIADAKKILRGGDDSITQFFKEKTQAQLTLKFLPIVTRSVEKLQLAQNYNTLVAQMNNFGLIKGEHAKIEAYVTRKALDGLYLMIGEEEASIRSNPFGYGSDILKKVFGGQ